MALCFDPILLSICFFQTCWKILCSETSQLTGIIQLIRGANQMSGMGSH